MPLNFISNTCAGPEFDTLAAISSFLATEPAPSTAFSVVDANAFLLKAAPAPADEVDRAAVSIQPRRCFLRYSCLLRM